MSAPDIEVSSGVIVLAPAPIVGLPITPFVLYAFGMPASGMTPPATWSATGLPAGLAIRNKTVFWSNEAREVIAGEIYGTATTAGTGTATITATNDTGSDSVSLDYRVDAAPVGVPTSGSLWNDLELDFDLGTRIVRVPGIAEPEEGIVFHCAKGDRFNLLIGLKKYGVLQDIKPGSEAVTIRLAIKEFEEERVIELASGAPVKVGTADYARFRIPLYLDPADWALLGDYEGDRKTGRGFPAQIEVAVDGSTYERFCSDTFKIGITRDQIED